MKAQVCEAPMNNLPSIRSGKVSKSREEDFEISLYLDKLRHLLPANTPTVVPTASRKHDKKINRLEVIENVIQYISELQEVLNIDVHARDMDLLEYETSSITLAA
ncbi:hypothetical protein GWK47_054206 [Chionoecetes opilio]|uniref:BHLH domain-containing protein n=1 Tax=Chionoecetes opilio TaxID=41210 RepID=A0A8J4Y779_CHIOP|nr:hypothetical protein GWK47_054206 [Chionoecetes opilio]